MRILILGPVVTKTYFGGVATFDQGLALGLMSRGCDVIIATDQKEFVNDDDNIKIIKVNWFSIQRVINEFKPDYIITELAYAKYLFLLKTKAKKVYFLHAFFKQSYYGLLKSILAVIYQKMLISMCDAVFSNSYFTAMINRDFFGINSDAVCHVGVTDDFYIKANRLSNYNKVKSSIFFAGRFVPAKGADKVIEAVKILNKTNLDFILYIAGDGPQKQYLLNEVQNNNLPVVFLGRLSQEQMIEQYAKSEVFITLDSSEPFGIVFLEALLSKCKIVCPYTGGQMEFIHKYGKSITYVNQERFDSIAEGIKYALEKSIVPQIDNEEKYSFTYSSVAENIIQELRNI